MSLKAAADAIPDSGLRVATACSFDEVGTVSSARGRQKANNDLVLNSTDDVLGGFDGLAGAVGALKKFRFIKALAAVYTNTTTTTALDESTNLTATYTTSIGTLVNAVKGLTAPTWSSSALLSGFAYGGYAYLCDGTAIQRLTLASGAPPTSTPNAWGLVSPGYHEFSATREDGVAWAGGSKADPLTTTNASATVTVDVDGGHSLGLSSTNGSTYPFNMNIELVGLKSVGGIKDNQINCLHSGFAGAGADDIAVTSSGTDDLSAAGVIFTITYQNNAGGFDWSAVNVQSPSGGATALDQTLSKSTTTHGSEADGTNEVQTIYYVTPATQGYFRLKVSRGGGDYEITENIPYNATIAQVKAALLALSYFSSGTASTSVCSVTSATQFTFTIPSADASAVTAVAGGGGAIGFMRQGPTLAATASGGELVGGTYYYAYTFYNGVAESNFSAQVPIVANTNDSVALTNVLIGPVGTTERRIYRTDVNGRQLYEIGRISDNTTFAFTDKAKLAQGADPFAQPGDTVTDAEQPANESDEQARGKRSQRRGHRESEVRAKAAAEKQREKLSTNLGLLADWTDHDPPPVGLKHVGLVGETVFGIIGTSLAFSKAGVPEHWPLSNRVKPGRNTSETLQAWVKFDRDCIMYTKNGLYRLSQVGLSFEDSRFEEIESPVGLAGEWAVAALDGQQGHIFLSKAGLYLFDGARVTEISFPIEPMFTDSTNSNYINPLYMDSAIMVTSRDRMYMTYATTNAGNDRLLICDFQDMQDPKFTVIPWGFTSMWREQGDNYVLAGTSGSLLYVLDTGYTDDGAAIAWAVTSKEFRFNGQTMTQLDECVLDADLAGGTTAIVVTTRGRGSTKTATYSSTASGRQRLKFPLPVYMKCETAQIAVSSSYAGKRSLYEWGFTSAAFEDEP